MTGSYPRAQEVEQNRLDRMKLWAWPLFPQNWQCSTARSRCAVPVEQQTTCECVCVCVYCLNSHITVFQSLDQPSKLTITSNIYYLALGLILMNTPEQFKSRSGMFWHSTSDMFAGQQHLVLRLILFPGSSVSPPSSCSVSVEWSLPLATGSVTGVCTADTTAATAAGFPLVPFTSCDLVTWSGTSRDERFTYRWNPF